MRQSPLVRYGTPALCSSRLEEQRLECHVNVAATIGVRPGLPASISYFSRRPEGRDYRERETSAWYTIEDLVDRIPGVCFWVQVYWLNVIGRE